MLRGCLILFRKNFFLLVLLLQILCTALENEPYHHVIDDPFDGRMVVGEDSGGLVTSFEIGKCHLHGRDQQGRNARVLCERKKIHCKVFWNGWLFGAKDHGVQRAGDIHGVDGGEDGCHRSGESVDETAVAGDAGAVDGQDSVVG